MILHVPNTRPGSEMKCVVGGRELKICLLYSVLGALLCTGDRQGLKHRLEGRNKKDLTACVLETHISSMN